MYRSGEGTLLVTEQLAFQIVERDSGARMSGPRHAPKSLSFDQSRRRPPVYRNGEWV
jgi:hypothetical protein